MADKIPTLLDNRGGNIVLEAFGGIARKEDYAKLIAQKTNGNRAACRFACW